MKLINLTEAEIKDFAGPVIFGRGYGYYKDEMVYEFDYNPSTDGIVAEVHGNYGDYEVEITVEGGEIDAYCTCPYDGYPCKHVVAVLLTLIHNKETYFEQAEEQQREVSSLKGKIQKLSKAELADMVLSGVNKYPDFQRDVAVRLEPEKKLTLNAILKQVNKAFPDIESQSYSPPAIARQLTTILKSVADGPAEIRIKVYWAVIDRTLEELNEYGMDEESLEGVAIDTMEWLVETFNDNDQFREDRHSIIGGLMDYYIRGNCGIVDSIYETAHALCSEESDYRSVIQKLEGHLPRSGFKSYYQNLLSQLYEEVGDTDSQLRVLESNLEYGLDYWRLAEYWLERGNADKAMQIVLEGLDRGEGRKVELYAFVQERLQAQEDMDGMFELLRRKVDKKNLDDPWNMAHDSTYQYLSAHYQSTNDYQGQVKLLAFRLTVDPINLDFYKEAEKTLNSADWATFEAKMLSKLKKAIQEKKSAQFAWARDTGVENQTLAEIYDYKNDLEKLFEVAGTDVALLVKYESKLLPRHPDIYVERYAREIDRLIAMRGREKYQMAAQYAQRVKRIHQNILKTPDKWREYIDNLRSQNKKLRALQEELSGL